MCTTSKCSVLNITNDAICEAKKKQRSNYLGVFSNHNDNTDEISPNTAIIKVVQTHCFRISQCFYCRI